MGCVCKQLPISHGLNHMQNAMQNETSYHNVNLFTDNTVALYKVLYKLNYSFIMSVGVINKLNLASAPCLFTVKK